MTPTAYPLQWPEGWPRTSFRSKPKFRSELSSALRNLSNEVRLMGGKNLILSSNCALGQSNHNDPGVVAYFEWDKVNLAVPCDRWDSVAANVQAISLTIEAMRGMERWGAKHMIRAMFSGFKMIPEKTGERKWWEVLHVDPTASNQEVAYQYRELAKAAHPDRGGSNEKMSELNVAMECFHKERGLR